jgi:hypothetical protein
MDNDYEKIEPKTTLKWLNKHNGAAQICYELHKRIMQEFEGKLYGVVMGSAYGGELEALGTLWKDRGVVYGMDTFTTHPEHLAVDTQSDEARCMDHWYRDDIYGKEALQYDYQRQILDEQGLDNVILVKGEVNKDSCKDIPEIHYALIDMDMIVSMKNGYSALEGKIVKGGYLCLHDVLPDNHLGGYIYNWWYDEVLPKGEWKIVEEIPASHLGIYRKI